MHLTCLSLVSPVGYGPRSTAAALRAGIPAFTTLSYQDAAGEALVGAPVEALPEDMRGPERLAALIRLAFEELDPAHAEDLRSAPMPLILCTREAQRPGAQLGGIAGELRFADGTFFQPSQTAHLAEGSTAVVRALALARTLFRETAARTCLLLAVDSLIDARALAWLDRHKRLKTSEQTDGIIPGEAACLALLSAETPAEGGLSVLGLGLATETATVMNDEPFRAEGLTAALRAALGEAGLDMHHIDFRLSDVAGESYAFEELALAQTRLMRKVRPSQPFWHPADCVGDCGAAAGLVQLAWAEQAFVRGYAPGPIAALHASSAFGARAAAVIADPGRAQ